MDRVDFTAMSVVMKFSGFANGEPSPYDDKYLVYFGMPTAYGPDEADLEVTSNVSQAKRFEDLGAARAEWMRVDLRYQTRADGKPNRPLTALNIVLHKVPA